MTYEDVGLGLLVGVNFWSSKKCVGPKTCTRVNTLLRVEGFRLQDVYPHNEKGVIVCLPAFVKNSLGFRVRVVRSMPWIAFAVLV